MSANDYRDGKFVGFLLCLVTIGVLSLFAKGVSLAKDGIDSYVDARINDSVDTLRQQVYNDLYALHPTRVGVSRHGHWYVR